MQKVRRPSQAGAFYEANPKSLRSQIESCFRHELGPGKLPNVARNRCRHVVGLVCPHAGYVYSGPVAAQAYYELASDGKPDTVVILAPNHTGYGSALAAMNNGSWRTPLGDIAVDSEVANAIVHESHIVDIDESAHEYEHSVEVQLPFLQYLYGSDFKIVPICYLMQDLASVRDIGQAIGKVLLGKNAITIASSDMTHYEPQSSAERKDRAVLDAVEAMDEERLFSIVQSENVTACGAGPIASLIVAAKALDAKKARLLCYKTSGDVIGDYSSVVGYSAVCFTK